MTVRLAPLARSVAPIAVLLPFLLGGGGAAADTPPDEETAVVLPDGPAARVRALIDDGRASEAETLARASLLESETAGGPRTAAALDLLDRLVSARLALDLGKDPETRALAERAVAARRAAPGSGGERLADSLVQLARTLANDPESRPRAARLLDEAQAAAEAAPDGAPLVARIHETRALLRGLERSLDVARTEAERSLAIRDARFGRRHTETARALDVLARIEREARELPRALSLAGEARTIRESVLRPGHPAIADSLATEAACLLLMGRHEGVRDLLERAIEIRRAAFGVEHRLTLDVKWNLALQLSAEGELEASEALHRELIAVYEKQGGPANPQLQGVLRNLGSLYNRWGRLEDARDAFARALAVAEANDAPPAALGRELHNLALMLKPLGELGEAHRLFERALELLVASDGPDSRAVSLVLHSFGNLEQDLGEYTEARSMFERSLAIREKRLGADHVLSAHSVVGVAESLWSLGDRAAARAWLEKGLGIFRRLERRDPGGEAYVLAQLGTLLAELGDFEGAQRHLDDAIGLKSHSGRQARESMVLEALAGLRVYEGRLDEAIRRYEDAVRARLARGQQDHPDLATTLYRLADAQSRAGRHADARARLTRALAIRTASFGASHPEASRARIALSVADRVLGRDGPALDGALEAHEQVARHVSLIVGALSERRALAFAAGAPDGLGIALSVVAEAPSAGRAARAWDGVIATRALVLDEMARRMRTTAGDAGGERGVAAARLLRARTRLANLIVSGPAHGNADVHTGILERAREESEAAERAIATSRGRGEAAARGPRPGWKEVVAALPPGSVLVAFVRYGHVDGRPYDDREEKQQRDVTPRDSYLAFAGRAGETTPELIRLGPADRIDALVDEWRREVSAEPPALLALRARAEERYARAASDLRRAVWDPLLPSIGSARTVFVVPDGDLNFVSFATLTGADGRYLVETGPVVHLLASEIELVDGSGAAGAEGYLLAVGAPDYDADPRAMHIGDAGSGAAKLSALVESSPSSSPARRAPDGECVPFRERRFSPLSASAAEVRDIALLWRRSHAANAPASSRIRILSGASATEGAFRRLARHAGSLHLATHGFFVGTGCPVPEPAVPGARGTAFLPGGTREAASPLMLSGIALAGGNRRHESGGDEHDGVLTAREIAALDLSRTGWVVLSACDTGLGALRPREGVLGLRRAFRIAGARSIVMSLWSVRDDAAREWMKRLYLGRSAGLSTADAVHDASAATLADRRRRERSTHPFYWGAFVATGDWR